MRSAKTEKQLEAKFLAELTRRLPGFATKKLNDLFSRGWPDRLVLGPAGFVAFIELKREGGVLSPLQRERIAWLEANGHRVAMAVGAGGVASVLARLERWAAEDTWARS